MIRTNTIDVIVAEDEPIILSNITNKIELAASYYHVAGTAENGREALALLEKNPQVRLLITDIEMPGMNGLELIEIVRSQYPQVYIVILSGYSNFEYARKAMRFGVSDYLLKPIAQDTLNEILDPISQKIVKEQNQEFRNILTTTLTGTNQEAFASSNTDSQGEFPHQFNNGQFLLVYVTLGNLPSRYVQPGITADDKNIWEQLNFDHCLRDYDAIEKTWLIDEVYLLQKMMIIYTSKKVLISNFIAQSFFNYLKDQLQNMPFTVTVSSELVAYPMLWSKSKLLREFTSMNAQMFRQCCHIVPESKSSLYFPKKKTDKLKKELMESTSMTQLLNFMQQNLVDFHSQNYPEYVTDTFLYDIFSLIPDIFGIEEVHCMTDMVQILSRLYSYADSNALFAEIKESIENLFSKHSDCIYSDTLCQKVKQYINEHYNHKINLNKLAERYGYTPSYLHRTFKKSLGVSPLQYMTAIRMNHAKSLLVEYPDLDMKEVAQKIGYEDSRYFSRVFKNEIGMTPSQWVKNQIPLIQE